ncbi:MULTISPECIES: FecCD family ABC transporter permease [Desulfococcus]|uniref:ABC-type transporter, integral membrane subunit n=1 Tax=Desulfococcus multivorans DSM 2059 TaxID=1121405 RepID=S7TSB2_DESML|nr:iron ABC transporter permease [Desulfococcus multivorans]AQU99639.2 iron ABC transporter permease [Desulfococcus multivorans]EPR39901.1 ABC-type transporter, integral membrane subunit [Desulfococcus multivorans DSM 2059]MDX9819342.1 iron ABC transporter permease [Desulfococcus multivorans]SKA22944.1 iron complex transport system permease protein [Desulfococcus multivorans DSM 2059]
MGSVSGMDGAVGTATRAYRLAGRRKRMLLSVLGGGILVLAFWAVTQGAYELTLDRIFRALTGELSPAESVVIWNIRLPRIFAAMVMGWGLAVSGLGIQSLLKNPLGSPATLGISQGAAFGAASAIVVFSSSMMSATAFAFIGAMVATGIILLLARLKRLAPEAVILAGVALSSLFTSATMLIQYLATETELAVVVFWTFGDVARSDWRDIGIATVAVAVVTLFFMIRRWDLNALASGEETACGLGVNVDRMRLQGMAAAALVAALATAFCGVIAFVGLIAPHMARRLVGADHSLLIPFSGVLGALLLLSADTLGRVVVGSGAMPVGVVTSFLGAPMFLYLLIRGYR